MWLNYDENYAVSDDGYVMNRITGLILSPTPDRCGRLQIHICGKIIRIHRMVALRFCPKINLPGLEVDHINRDNTDNRASNLRWVDKSTNQRNKNSSNIYKRTNAPGYDVRFRARGKGIYCKYFKTIEEATAARDAFRLSIQ